MKHALVVGAGVTGCSAALALARHGYSITVLEASSRVGGQVLSYCCKATDTCSRCGVCVAHAAVAEALRHPGVRFVTGAAIQRVDRQKGSGKWSARVAAAQPAIDAKLCIDCRKCVEACPERCISRYSRGGLVQYAVDHDACRLHRGAACDSCAKACPADAVAVGAPARAVTVSADAVIVAIGHQAFDPVVKPRLGYRRLPGVMTGLEAEQLLSERMSIGGVTAGRASVAFIQCVGSRDPSLGRNYCSSVCCAYALRMARVLKSRSPEADVTVYAIDIQNFDKAQRAFREAVEAAGVRIVRGVPSQVARHADGRLHLLIEDPATGATTAVHDTVILSVGMQPVDGAGAIAGHFGLQRDEFGFLRSKDPGVIVAGTCGQPQGLSDAMAAGRAAALATVGTTA